MLLPCQNAQFIKKNYLDKYIYGQNQATPALATAVAQHFLACEYNELCDIDSRIKNVSILVMGPSGSGKSEFARTLKRLCVYPAIAGMLLLILLVVLYLLMVTLR